MDSQEATLLAEVIKQNEYLRGEYDSLEESMNDLSLRIEDIGWTRISAMGTDGSGFDLKNLKTVAEPLSDMLESNVLLQRACDLRHAYVFADGVHYRGVDSKATKNWMAKPVNINALFGSQAQKMRIKSRMSDGNVFILRHKSRQELIQVPLREITDVIVDEDDSSRIMFLKREWKGNSATKKKAWYKTSTNDRTDVPESKLLKNVEIDYDYVIYHQASNRQAGWVWGVPDAMAAMKWAEAYNEYLENNAKLVRAYGRIASKVKAGGSKAQKDAPVQIASQQGTDTYGATAVFGGNSDFQQLPPLGSGVNFNNGRPMAALVAAGLGVSVVALLSDPGQTGAGSVAETLDLPTAAVMQMLQQDDKYFVESILHDMRAPNAIVEFPTMDADPVYRKLQSFANAYATGAIFQDEYREKVIDLLDIVDPKAGLPKPDEFNTGHTPGDEEAPDPIARQGNSGANGEGIGTNNDARDRGEYASGEQ